MISKIFSKSLENIKNNLIIDDYISLSNCSDYLETKILLQELLMHHYSPTLEFLYCILTHQEIKKETLWFNIFLN